MPTKESIEGEVRAVARKCASISKNIGHGNHDWAIEELGLLAVSHLAGQTALHDVDECKTPEFLDWAKGVLIQALEET